MSDGDTAAERSCPIPLTDQDRGYIAHCCIPLAPGRVPLPGGVRRTQPLGLPTLAKLVAKGWDGPIASLAERAMSGAIRRKRTFAARGFGRP